MLAPYQIIQSSRDPEKVAKVERSFRRWKRQVESILTQGKQIRRDPPDVGPLNELEHWRQMLSRYTSVVEFVKSKPFLSHLQCLTLSRSKMVKVDLKYFYLLNSVMA